MIETVFVGGTGACKSVGVQELTVRTLESLGASATRVWLVVSHPSVALSIINAERKIRLSDSWLAILCTEISTCVLAKSSSVLFVRSVGFVAITGVFSFFFSLLIPNTLGAMQANMLSTGADFELVLTLDTKIAFGAHAVLPKTMRFIELFELVPKLLKQLIVLLSTAALSTILALQFALVNILAVAELANRTVETIGAVAASVLLLLAGSAIHAEQLTVLINGFVAIGGRFVLAKLSRKRFLIGVGSRAVTGKFHISIRVLRLQAGGPVEASIVSTLGSRDLALGAKESFRTIAVHKVAIMTRPKFAVDGSVIVLDSQLAVSAVLALQVTVGNKTSVKLAVRTTMSGFALTRIRSDFKVILASSLVGAKDFRVTALRSPLDFAVFSNIRRTVVLSVTAVAKEQIRLYHCFVHAFNALAAVVTKMVRVLAFLVRAIASEARHVFGTFTVPSVDVCLLEEVKGNAVFVFGVKGKVSVALNAGGTRVTINAAGVGL